MPQDVQSHKSLVEVGPSTPTVAVALGAGGARGLAHIHVLEALEEMGIEPVAIAGSSIGAIIGAGKAAGMSAAEMRDHALETVGKRNEVFKRIWGLRPPTMRHAIGGFRLGQFNLERILRAFLPSRIPDDFSGLGIPLKVISTDYYGHCEQVSEDGDLYQALAASAAIPALFMPVMLNGRLMIDGGIFNPVPYEHLMGLADIVIGIDIVGGPVGVDDIPNRIDSLFGASQLMMQSHLALKLKLGPPAIFLRPPVNGFGVMDFMKAKQIFEVSAPVKDEVKRALEAQFALLAQR
ncbi:MULTISPECIES: patatin-like phospholipase family protein [Rhizobium/Agrobacterium group]|uniref:Patatin-like phospholipase family protein n=1 Tax=Agrobacterium vitis TaxID=373 RepID=A0AAE4WQJ3_AGRVI|nr:MULTISPECIES: patatin-like phospholipase family protein [Rhizobium/Agrobacterium group]MBF2717074.1 patatin-like phospholipase family protein [Agrobacterium vitis]MCF1434812.1 patatin-like phospholipase family protein [Allorhizobium ampelinum]MCF1473197.1 patatin-like phospholipase family protein [Allorhizobium ampelinum]MCF1484585.1 patatin-like phospholipase family protein [Allorhizobium ampelinum]MUO88238.1 patatin-like phospholipase family protein [Agrobacterium vitis]